MSSTPNSSEFITSKNQENNKVEEEKELKKVEEESHQFPISEGSGVDPNIHLPDIIQTIDGFDFEEESKLNLSFDVNVFEESGISVEETYPEDTNLQPILDTPVKEAEEEGKKDTPTLIKDSPPSSEIMRAHTVVAGKVIQWPKAIHNRLAIYHHPNCMNHHIPRHPEQPKRVEYILKALNHHFQSYSNVSFRQSTVVTVEQIRLFHTNYVVESFLKKWEECQEIYEKQNKIIRRSIDGDTEIMYATKDAAFYSAGSMINAIDHVFLPKDDLFAIDTAFCCVRPPGHHAEPNRAGGFCFFNNAAIGALYAREKYGVKKVAVLDFDVHHGNGTEEGFKSDENLFYGSTHQRDCYPGSGPDPTPFIGEKAKSPLDRRIVDRMLTPGDASRKEFHVKWKQILQEMELFKPEFIIISAGFDAHSDDPLADCELIEDDYEWATIEILKSGLRINWESPPRVVSILEGGYDLDAISRSAVVHVKALYEGYESIAPKVAEELERTQSNHHRNGDEIEALKDFMKDLGI